MCSHSKPQAYTHINWRTHDEWHGYLSSIVDVQINHHVTATTWRRQDCTPYSETKQMTPTWTHKYAETGWQICTFKHKDEYVGTNVIRWHTQRAVTGFKQKGLKSYTFRLMSDAFKSSTYTEKWIRNMSVHSLYPWWQTVMTSQWGKGFLSLGSNGLLYKRANSNVVSQSGHKRNIMKNELLINPQFNSACMLPLD